MLHSTITNNILLQVRDERLEKIKSDKAAYDNASNQENEEEEDWGGRRMATGEAERR